MKKLLLLFLLLVITGCAPRTNEPPMTQLQIREIQTRAYPISDMKMVMKAMINVLQDEGYMISNSSLDLGLLSAEKNIDVESTFMRILARLADAQNARWDKQTTIVANANVSSFGETTRIRMSFQSKTVDNFGCPSKTITLYDACLYEDFFSKVSKALFLQGESI